MCYTLLIETLITLNKVEKIVHIGFDSSEVMIKALQSDQLYGFVVQGSFEMSYQGVRSAYLAMQRKSVKNKIDTRVIFVSRDDK